MIKNFIFDWGGVLASGDNQVATLLLGKKYDLDKNEFIKYFDDNEGDYSTGQNSGPLLSGAEDRFGIPKREIMASLNSAKPNEVYYFAKKLSKKMDVYVLSNQPDYRVSCIKDNYELSFFKDVVFSWDVKLKKPDEKIYQHLLIKNNLTADECLFIDNNPDNIETANRIGMQTYLFKTPKDFILFIKTLN
jgi:putative hydrolase of the HAD superfamily